MFAGSGGRVRWRAGAKGVSALQLSRDLNVQYKTAFVLAHKLREAMAAEHGSIVYADDAASWDALHAFYDARRINHSIAFHDEGVSTNWAESFLLAAPARGDRPASPHRRSPAPVRGRDGMARG